MTRRDLCRVALAAHHARHETPPTTQDVLADLRAQHDEQERLSLATHVDLVIYRQQRVAAWREALTTERAAEREAQDLSSAAAMLRELARS